MHDEGTQEAEQQMDAKREKEKLRHKDTHVRTAVLQIIIVFISKCIEMRTESSQTEQRWLRRNRARAGPS